MDKKVMTNAVKFYRDMLRVEFKNRRNAIDYYCRIRMDGGKFVGATVYYTDSNLERHIARYELHSIVSSGFEDVIEAYGKLDAPELTSFDIEEDTFCVNVDLEVNNFKETLDKVVSKLEELFELKFEFVECDSIRALIP